MVHVSLHNVKSASLGVPNHQTGNRALSLHDDRGIEMACIFMRSSVAEAIADIINGGKASQPKDAA